MRDLVPAHVTGRRLEVLTDPKDTLDQKGVSIGGYIRISTRKDSQLSSIENQKKLLSQWAEVNGYNLVRFYIDVKSGEYAYLRDEMNQLREDIRLGRVKGVVTKEISRTSRDVMDILELKREIACYGGFFISIKENYDSRTDDDEFLLVLHAALAQRERKTTASRVKVTQIIKAKEGKTNVPHPAYGYKLSEDGQHLVVNPETAPIYRMIVEKFLEGWGQAKIAKYLNQLGIPSKRGCKWCSNAIRTILSNPVYLGITIYNTTTRIRDPSGRQKQVMRPREEWIIREGTHEPLITPEEFEKIQQIIQRRREKDTKEWTCDRKYLGSSILRCAECGGKIFGFRYPKKVNGKKAEGQYLYYYRCTGANGKCSPPMKHWYMEKVDYLIMELFRSIFADKERLMLAVKEQSSVFDQDTEGLAAEREKVRQRLDQIEKAMRKQQVAYEEDVITLEEYRGRIAELREERHLLMQKLESLNEKLTRSDTLMDRLNAIYEKISKKLDRIHELPYEEKITYVSATFEAIYLRSDYTISDVVFKLA